MVKHKRKRSTGLNFGVAEAIKSVGSQSELARKMKVEQPAVHHWLYYSCPPERALEIEQLCGVPREKTCPEIFKA